VNLVNATSSGFRLLSESSWSVNSNSISAFVEGWNDLSRDIWRIFIAGCSGFREVSCLLFSSVFGMLSRSFTSIVALAGIDWVVSRVSFLKPDNKERSSASGISVGVLASITPDIERISDFIILNRSVGSLVIGGFSLVTFIILVSETMFLSQSDASQLRVYWPSSSKR